MLQDSAGSHGAHGAHATRPVPLSPHGPVGPPMGYDRSDLLGMWITGYMVEGDEWAPDYLKGDVFTAIQNDDSQNPYKPGETVVVHATKTSSRAVLAARAEDEQRLIDAGDRADDAHALTQWYAAVVGRDAEATDPGILGVVVQMGRWLR